MLTKHLTTLILSSFMTGIAMADSPEIIRSVTDIAAGADRHDWQRVRAAFADEVTVDYTSLWGGEPSTLSADALISAWSGFLPGFDTTHHMLSNHTVTNLLDTTASAEADFTATHRINDDLWVLGGRYHYSLEKTEARWAVSAITMTALWETGDRGLVALAGERAAQTD